MLYTYIILYIDNVCSQTIYFSRRNRGSVGRLSVADQAGAQQMARVKVCLLLPPRSLQRRLLRAIRIQTTEKFSNVFEPSYNVATARHVYYYVGILLTRVVCCLTYYILQVLCIYVQCEVHVKRIFEKQFFLFGRTFIHWL